MMVFGKQSPSDVADRTSTVSTRSYHVSMNERKPEETPVNNESSSTISKLLPIQPDNMSVNLTTRYDLSILNRPPLAVDYFLHQNEFDSHMFWLLEIIEYEKICKVK